MGKRSKKGGQKGDADGKEPKFVEDHPDIDDPEFHRNEVDSFHYDKEKISLDKFVKSRQKKALHDEPEEVFGVRVDSENEEGSDEEDVDSELDMDSDLDQPDDPENYLPSAEAWGSRRGKFYGADAVHDDHADLAGSDLDDAELEAEEARRQQKTLTEKLTDADFQLDFMEEGDADVDDKEDDQEENILQPDKEQEDLTAIDSLITDEQRMDYLIKQSPELQALLTDLEKIKLYMETKLKPIIDAVTKLKDPLRISPGLELIQRLYQIYANYVLNISFYAYLQNTRGFTKNGANYIRNHPVIDRIMQWKKLIANLESKLVESTDFFDQVDTLVMRIEKAEDLSSILYQPSDSPAAAAASSAENVEMPFRRIIDGLNDGESLLLDDANDSEDGGEDDDETDPNKKRGITYEIFKNKGLQPHRKKEQRNPRVKHRRKFADAQKRRRSKVPDVRRDPFKYGGETRGIRTSVVKSTKFS